MGLDFRLHQNEEWKREEVLFESHLAIKPKLSKYIGVNGVLDWPSNGKQAKELIGDLESGLVKLEALKDDPNAIKRLTTNDMDFSQTLEFLQDVTEACKQFPLSIVSIGK